jgi:hypothetical protein
MYVTLLFLRECHQDYYVLPVRVFTQFERESCSDRVERVPIESVLGRGSRVAAVRHTMGIATDDLFYYAKLSGERHRFGVDFLRFLPISLINQSSPHAAIQHPHNTPIVGFTAVNSQRLLCNGTWDSTN